MYSRCSIMQQIKNKCRQLCIYNIKPWALCCDTELFFIASGSDCGLCSGSGLGSGSSVANRCGAVWSRHFSEWSRSRLFCWSEPRSVAASTAASFRQEKKESLVLASNNFLGAIYRFTV